MLIVMKFGGTSVGSAERISLAAELAARSREQGHRVVVVTSAMSGVTNHLITAATTAAQGTWNGDERKALEERHMATAEQLLATHPVELESTQTAIRSQLDRFEKLCFGLSMVHELSPRLLDAISATGEMLAAPLVSGAIAARGIRSSAVSATQLIVTNDQFGAAEPLDVETRTNTRCRAARHA